MAAVEEKIAAIDFVTSECSLLMRQVVDDPYIHTVFHHHDFNTVGKFRT
jgi:hypothetical protein